MILDVLNLWKYIAIFKQSVNTKKEFEMTIFFLFPEKKHLLEASFTLGLSLHVDNILNREQSSSP